jgi:hypothetical protein
LVVTVQPDRVADRGVIGLWRRIIDPPLPLFCPARIEFSSARGFLRGTVAPVGNGILVSGLGAPWPNYSF